MNNKIKLDWDKLEKRPKAGDKNPHFKRIGIHNFSLFRLNFYQKWSFRPPSCHFCVLNKINFFRLKKEGENSPFFAFKMNDGVELVSF